MFTAVPQLGDPASIQDLAFSQESMVYLCILQDEYSTDFVGSDGIVVTHGLTPPPPQKKKKKKKTGTLT